MKSKKCKNRNPCEVNNETNVEGNDNANQGQRQPQQGCNTRHPCDIIGNIIRFI